MNDRINDTFNDILASLDLTIARLSQAGAQGEPDAKTERAYFQAQRRSYAKAQYHHLQGVQVVWTGMAWLVPSATRPGVVHRVSRVGSILVCDCEASANQRACWHPRLVECYELTAERTDAFDDGLETADDCGGTLPPAPVLSLVPRPRDPNDDATYAEMLAAWPRAA